MKTLYYTRHARNRMRLYGISPEEVAEVLKEPSLTQSGEQGKQHAWKTTKTGATLRVTFKEEAEKCVIITATPKHVIPEA